MRNQLWKLFATLAVILLLTAACSGVAEPADQPDETGQDALAEDSGGEADIADDTPATVDEGQTDDAGVTEPEPSVKPTENSDTGDAAAPTHPDRPAEPAPPDQFRSDPPTVVAATGNPQLIEFFTFW